MHQFNGCVTTYLDKVHLHDANELHLVSRPYSLLSKDRKSTRSMGTTLRFAGVSPEHSGIIDHFNLVPLIIR